MILLDTCVLLFIGKKRSLPSPIIHALQGQPWAMSAMSAWEISIKYRIGKIALEVPPAQWWPASVHIYHLRVLPFTEEQALLAGDLPLLHADPFDRGIIATALALKIPLATVDPAFDRYAEACGLVLAGR